jgi:uncharacterized membrane protein
VRQQLPIGKPWFKVVGRSVEPITWEGWVAFYAIFTWIIGGTYYAFTGRDPLGLPFGGLALQVLGILAVLVFVVCGVICILKTDFSRQDKAAE